MKSENAWPIRPVAKDALPSRLFEITDPPKKLFARGTLPDVKDLVLTVIGSRKYTRHGKDACVHLIEGLAGYPFVIVSGLALGIDGIAHRSALKAGLPTIAVPGSGLADKVLYPRAHLGLAREILEAGGALLSEYEAEEKAQMFMFPKRNRIMAGLAQAALVIEAEEKSGSLITARLAMEYNRDVLAVPGPMFQSTGSGTHELIKDGAYPIRTPFDILEIFGVPLHAPSDEKSPEDLPRDEALCFRALAEPMQKDDLAKALGWSAQKTNIAVSSLAVRGLIVDDGNLVRRA